MGGKSAKAASFILSNLVPFRGHNLVNAEELMDIIDAGALNRSTGTTSANADSSRSHAVLQLSLRKDVGRIKNKEHGKI